MEYSINTNYLEIIAGTSNRYNPVYEAAAVNVEKNTDKGVNYLKNFLQSIEKISEKEAVKDERISKSKGNIRKFEGHDNIKFAVDFLSKNLKGIDGVADCIEMYDLILKYQPMYSDAYDLKNTLVIYEYESAVYMLVTNLSMIMANNMDVVANGTEIRIQKKNAETFGVIPKTMKELLKQMKSVDHSVYLEELNKTFENNALGKVTTEGVYVEGLELAGIMVTAKTIGSLAYGVLSNVFSIGKSATGILKKIRRSIFGIVPIIRSVAYLRYKKKADTILKLDEQVKFIEQNIEQLEKRTNINPKDKEVIIKKQKAIIEAYKKKSEKLRVEFMECEKEASNAIAKDDVTISKIDDNNDDFVLESGRTLFDVFSESKKNKINRKSMEEVKKFREDFIFDKILKKNNKKSEEKVAPEVKSEEDKFKDITKAAVKEFHESHTRAAIKLTIEAIDEKKDADKSTRLMSKIGGTPYWPKNMEWPKIDGKNGICYAQLNFGKLPKLEGFPESGIMQCFIKDEQTQDKCKIVYHKDTNLEDALDELPVLSYTQEDDYNSLGGSAYLVSDTTAFECTMNPDRVLDKNEYVDEIVANIATKVDKDWKTLKDVENDDKAKFDIIVDAIWDHSAVYGTMIGGWAFYTQGDHGFEDDQIQLLQIDDDADIQWGDCGLAHFFCKEDALKKLKFDDDDANFYWDCY